MPLDENSDSYTTTDSYFDGTGQEAKRVSIYSPDTTPSATLYFIYSSVLNKLISQADATGKKLKTFVPANGVTVAEQDLVTLGTTTSEHLYFIHQDASGASAEQTELRAIWYRRSEQANTTPWAAMSQTRLRMFHLTPRYRLIKAQE